MWKRRKTRIFGPERRALKRPRMYRQNEWIQQWNDQHAWLSGLFCLSQPYGYNTLHFMKECGCWRNDTIFLMIDLDLFPLFSHFSVYILPSGVFQPGSRYHFPLYGAVFAIFPRLFPLHFTSPHHQQRPSHHPTKHPTPTDDADS